MLNTNAANIVNAIAKILNKIEEMEIYSPDEWNMLDNIFANSMLFAGMSLAEIDGILLTFAKNLEKIQNSPPSMTEEPEPLMSVFVKSVMENIAQEINVAVNIYNAYHPDASEEELHEFSSQLFIKRIKRLPFFKTIENGSPEFERIAKKLGLTPTENTEESVDFDVNSLLFGKKRKYSYDA